MDADLVNVRDEIRQADEALVRELVALKAGSDGEWEALAEGRPAFHRRIALGMKVAETKFRMDPARFCSLTRAGDKKGLEQAITDVKTEEAVLERVRQMALALEGGAKAADRISNLYLKRIIPDTKTVQIKRLCDLG